MPSTKPSELAALLCGLLLAFSLPAAGQTGRGALEQALKNFFSDYTLPLFRPNILSSKLDRFEVDTDARTIHIYASEGFSSQAFTPEVVRQVYSDLRAALPSAYAGYDLRVYAFGRSEISELVPNLYRTPGERLSDRMWGRVAYDGHPWVRNASRPVSFPKGLEGRHLTVWSSHGRYYSHKDGKWMWQRPALFCTREDLFTQSVVVPFLLPMLENSGAVVYSPRERSWQEVEVIVDNGSEGYAETAVNEKHGWTDSPTPGFAHLKAEYASLENPFLDGTARYAVTSEQDGRRATCSWTPRLPVEGDYPVYVTYQTFDNSVDQALYTIVHQGVETQVQVNQQMGGSTWVYLGTFHFDTDCGPRNCVQLSNACRARGVVSADAVRFGGGRSNIVRGDSLLGFSPSGLPRHLEGARYAVQWSGLPDSVYSTKDGFNDYADDINVRSNALNYLGGGSPFIPDTVGLRVPMELSLAVHSDAGCTDDGTVVGTLAIHTTENSDGFDRFRSGLSRYASSDLATAIQLSVCNDLNRSLPSEWLRRELLDRNYSETRLPEVPSAILEMLSHQNFTDMKFGHDPHFKFLMARAVYKGVLRFLALQHATDCVVQPLPVHRFAAVLEAPDKVRLSWSPTTDPLEPSAHPDGYVIYTRQDGQDFDNGTVVAADTCASIAIIPDVVYSFKVCAYNAGGLSFPSEELSVMRSSAERREVLVVNGFTRLSGPAVIENDEQEGFDLDSDIGVPYIHTPEYCGRQYDFSRYNEKGRHAASFGQSEDDLIGTLIAGNSFNYPYVHGKAIQAARTYSFSSCSVEAFGTSVPAERFAVVDLILGLQKHDRSEGLHSYKTFTPRLMAQLSAYAQAGGRLVVSGSYIASDMLAEDEAQFTSRVLHYLPTAPVAAPTDALVLGNDFQFTLQQQLGASSYAVAHPDRLVPTDDAFPCFVYADGSCSAVAFVGEQSATVALGFPFEAITSADARARLMKMLLATVVE